MGKEPCTPVTPMHAMLGHAAGRPCAAGRLQARRPLPSRRRLTSAEAPPTPQPPPAAARLLMKALTSCKGADEVLELYAARRTDFTPMHLSVALQRVARSAQEHRRRGPAGPRQPADVATLESLLHHVGETMSATLLGLGTSPRGEARAATAAPTGSGGVFDVRGVADTFWALRRLRGLGLESSTGTDFEQQTAHFLETEWASLSGRDIATIAMVVPGGKMGAKRTRILGALERATLGIIARGRAGSDFDARSLATLAWAFAKCEHGSLGLYTSLARHWVEGPLPERSSARDVSTIVWALTSSASLPEVPIRTIGEGKEGEERQVAEFHAARDAAFAASVDLLIGLANAASKGGRRAVPIQPHDVAQGLWSFGKTYAHHPSAIEEDMHRLFAEMEPVAVGMADKFSSQGLCNVVWAYAVVRHPAGSLLTQFERVAVAQLKARNASPAAGGARSSPIAREWSFLNVANLLYAFATLGYDVGEDSELLEAASARLEALYMDPLAEVSPQSLANAVWSFAVMGFYNLDLLREAVRVVSEGASHPGSGVTLEHFSQLYYACLSLQKELESTAGEEFADSHNPVDDVNALLQDGLSDMREGTLSLLAINTEYFDTKLGQNHMEVVECLRRRQNANFQVEYVLAEGITCDIAFPESRIAVEVDGPSHFLYGTEEFTGKAQFKRRLLELLGWRCYTVTYMAWGQLPSMAARMEYLDGLLPSSLLI